MRRTFSFSIAGLILWITFCLGACSNNPNYQGRGENYLQGEWQQDSVPAQNRLLTFSLYHLTFQCDSFFFRVNTVSKVNYGADTCMNRGHWTEYMKGTYQQRHDTVFMDGGFCNPNYTLKADGGCFRTGSYREFFVISKKTASLIRFTGSTEVIPVTVRLIKKITCNPKPL